MEAERGAAKAAIGLQEAAETRAARVDEEKERAFSLVEVRVAVGGKDCHFAGTLSSSLLMRLRKGEGAAAE